MELPGSMNLSFEYLPPALPPKRTVSGSKASSLMGTPVSSPKFASAMHYESVSDTSSQHPRNSQSSERNTSGSPSPVASIASGREYLETSTTPVPCSSPSVPHASDVPDHSADRRTIKGNDNSNQHNRLRDDNHYIHLYNDFNGKGDGVKEGGSSTADNSDKGTIKEKDAGGASKDAGNRGSCSDNNVDDVDVVLLRNPHNNKGEQVIYSIYSCKSINKYMDIHINVDA